MAWNGPQWLEMDHNGLKWTKVAQNDPKRTDISQKMVKPYPPFNYEKSCFAKWSTLVHKLEVGVQQPLRSQMRWWEKHGPHQLRWKAIEKTVPTWSCLWSGFRWEFCQPIGQKRVAQSLEMTLSSMRGVAKEVCQILSADWDIGCDNILRVHIATFLAFALWLGRRSALVHLQWKWKLRVCQIKGSLLLWANHKEVH